MESNTKNPSANEEKIISRLKFFNYKYESEGNTLRIFLPIRCALKIVFDEGSVSMTSSFDVAPNINLKKNTRFYAK